MVGWAVALALVLPPARPRAEPAARAELVVQAFHEYGLERVRVSPDGRLFATSGSIDGLVKLWDARSGLLLRTYQGGIQRPLIAQPLGQSFDIGGLDEAAKRAIPLARLKAVVLRPVLGDDDNFDSLGLEARVRRLLRAPPSARTTSRHVFVDAADDELPGGFAPRGRYRIARGVATVTVKLFRDRVAVKKIQVSGPASQPDRIALDLVKAIEAALPDEGR